MQENYDYTIHYRRYHDGSLQDLENMGKMYEKMLGPVLIKHSRTCNVLDYGCGDGALVHYLSQKFENVIGVDASKEQISTARRHGISVSHLPIKDFASWCDAHSETFDIVFIFDVLEHIEVSHQIDFMRNLAKILKHQGTIFVKVPNATSPLAGRWRYIDWTHRTSFTEASLDFVLLNCGFSQPIYHIDESELKPEKWWIPRYSLTRFYIKSLFRWLWWLYLRCELGKEANSIPRGINLFASATKTS